MAAHFLPLGIFIFITSIALKLNTEKLIRRLTRKDTGGGEVSQASSSMAGGGKSKAVVAQDAFLSKSSKSNGEIEAPLGTSADRISSSRVKSDLTGDSQKTVQGVDAGGGKLSVNGLEKKTPSSRPASPVMSNIHLDEGRRLIRRGGKVVEVGRGHR